MAFANLDEAAAKKVSELLNNKEFFAMREGLSIDDLQDAMHDHLKQQPAAVAVLRLVKAPSGHHKELYLVWRPIAGGEERQSWFNIPR